ILVIDGGGMRGLASLLIIDAIMKELPTKNGRALLPCQVFDLICGTSVGGLVSILLGRLGLDCETAIDIYELAVKELFSEKGDVWKIIADGRFLDTSKFDAFVAHIVTKYTGSPDISIRLPLQDNQDLHSHPSTKMFVTMMESAPSYTHTISSYKRQLSPSASRHWTVPEIARTTIASPIYISPQTFQTDKLRRFQDSGFGGYNNPMVLASSEWKKIWPEERIGLVLSLGTG
ncbi:acyl transferase/acyl hydrolase/lysophospholipase, partial [Amanita rubescens]